MTSPSGLLVVCTTVDSEKTAIQLARQVIEQKLAACIHLISGVQSFYRWEEKVQLSQEWVLQMKTLSHQYDALEQFLQQHHPYQVPEIISFNVQHSSESYMQWIYQCLEVK